MTPRRLVPALVLAVLAGGLEVSAPPSALAHEEGAIELDPERAAAGSEITIRGENFDEEIRLKLLLRGVLETRDLGEVVTDEEGEFRVDLLLPAAAGSGRYVVIAVAPDGDEVARADLEIVPAAEADRRSGDAASGPREATDAHMPIEAERGVLEWLVIVAFFLACGLGGLALLRAD